MSDTDHQSELEEVKAKAFKVLREEGVLRVLEAVLDGGLIDEERFEKFSSSIKATAPNTDIEAEHEEKFWRHHAYLLGGTQKIQISYFEEFDIDVTSKTATLYVLSNDEIVLHDNGSAERVIKEYSDEPWRFRENYSFYLQVVKLNKVWMEALPEIVSADRKVRELENEHYRRLKEERAEKEKSNFDLGDFD